MTELVRRYVVMPLATEAPFDPADPDGVFVLKPWKDPAALSALRAYRDRCFPELRRDLDAWIRAIESGPSVRGDVGRRNEPFARAVARAGAGRSRDAGQTPSKAIALVKPRPSSATSRPARPSRTSTRTTASQASASRPVARTPRMLIASKSKRTSRGLAKGAGATKRRAASTGRKTDRAERRPPMKKPTGKPRRR